MKNFYKKGISVAEILIVIAVLVMIFSIVLPQFSEVREKQVLKSAVENILSSLNKAQTQTLASMDSSSYGVNFESDKITIFKGTIFSEGEAGNEVMSITSPANISNVTLGGVSASSGDMYFNRISGSPNKSGTISIATPNFTKIITISATGSISAN
jgi:Tfp pilus assembly protein FimT